MDSRKKFRKNRPNIDRIAVSVFVDILVEFDKYGIRSKFKQPSCDEASRHVNPNISHIVMSRIKLSVSQLFAN